MSDFVYKCVAVPSVVNTGKVGEADHSAAVAHYEQCINTASQGGWELVQVDSVTSQQQPGCFQYLMGKREEVITFKMLIFKRPK